MTLRNTKNLRKQVVPFEKSSTRKSIWQLVNSILPFLILWYLAYISLSITYWLTFISAILAAGFLVRIFIIFHDCTHHSFFKSRLVNRVVGTMMGVLTLFPFDKWGYEHSVHHATSGNLDKRGTGDIWTFTVEEYFTAPLSLRLAYRCYRSPFVMFGLGPIYVFLLKNRFNRKGARRKERMNTYLTNILIVVLMAFVVWAIGWQSFLLVQAPIFIISGAVGIWLFYVQHTFEDSYFEEDKEWQYVKAAVEGSSFYKLPKLLQWLTGNIGYHHVHHLSPRVPNYRLEEVHEHTSPLQKVPTITLVSSLQSLRFRLWDEKTKRFVTFKDARAYLEEHNSLQTEPKI